MTLDIMLVAGEPSGDSLGAAVMESLGQKTKETLKFRGVGGPQMTAAGLNNLVPFDDLAVMGIGEVITRIPRLLKHLSTLEEAIKFKAPDVLITIDSPDFNFRLAKRVRKFIRPIIHYVAPSVWAWRPNRAKIIAAFFDHLLTLLPFEPPLFEREGLPSTFVGHPVVSGYSNGNGEIFRDRYDITQEERILVVLPGSRKTEVLRLLPIFAETAKFFVAKYPNYRVVMMPHDGVQKICRTIMDTIQLPRSQAIIFSPMQEKANLFSAADLALAASGTVTLELAVAGVPTVVGYKMHSLSYIIAQRLVKVKWISLANIILEEEVIPEFIQSRCSSVLLSEELANLFSDSNALEKRRDTLKRVRQKFKTSGAAPSNNAAEIILREIYRCQKVV